MRSVFHVFGPHNLLKCCRSCSLLTVDVILFSPPPRGIIDTLKVENVEPVRRAERELQLAVRMATVDFEKVEEKKS